MLFTSLSCRTRSLTVCVSTTRTPEVWWPSRRGSGCVSFGWGAHRGRRRTSCAVDALRRDAIRRTSFVLVAERGEPFWKLLIGRGDKSSYAFVPRWGGKENCFPIGIGSDETFIFVQEPMYLSTVVLPDPFSTTPYSLTHRMFPFRDGCCFQVPVRRI